MSSISEKICVDCNISKTIDKFPKGGKVCHPCGYIRRTKNKTKECKICNEIKSIPEFNPKSNVCKKCREKEKSENGKTCVECNILKPVDKFTGNGRICNHCRWINKRGSKECPACKETKVVSEFTGASKICKTCCEKEKLEDNKICKKCNILKPKSKFEQTRNICRDCRYIQRTNGKNKTCKICNETKFISNFKRDIKLCIECSSSEKFKDNRLCKKCEEIKPKSEFYGASWVCKPCTKVKFQEKLVEMKKCEGCNLEKENKYFREISSKMCLECEDISITKKCRDCNETKSIAEFNPKRGQCHECEKADGRDYRKTTTKAKEWVENNKERMTELQKNYYEKNKKEIRKKETDRRNTEEQFRKVKNYKACIPHIIKGKCQTSSQLYIDREKYLLWLQYNFKDGMTLENYSDVWCIDHVMPLSAIYKLSSNFYKGIIKNSPEKEKFILCWYNTIPLLKLENRLKEDKIDKETLKNHVFKIQKFFKDTHTKKDELFFQYKKFIRDVLEFIRY